MSYGVKVYSPAGDVWIDSSTYTFSYIDTLLVSGSGSKSYPNFAGWTFYTSPVQDRPSSGYAEIFDATFLNVSISYGSGYPVITWSQSVVIGTAQTIDLLVFGR